MLKPPKDPWFEVITKRAALNEWFERAFVYLGASTAVQRRFLVLSAAIALGYLEWFVILSWSTHGFVLDHSGHPVPRDFLAFWTAGRDALNGSAPLAYKPNWMHAAEVTAVGHGFIGDLRWRYPPAFFLVAAALSVLPYETAFLIWICTTAFAYALAASRAARYRGAFLIALAAPWTFINIFLGQNGFLSASILGFALLQLRLRPALGGAILGLLIYKPQFGLLIPFALGAGGHWRAFGSAAIVALVSNVIAAFLFGPETLSAFAHETTEFATTMSVPGIHFSFQSLYAVLHDAGNLTARNALLLQACWTIVCAFVISVVWRSRTPFALKAALLLAATPISAQYVFTYDLPVLAISVAFLRRHRDLDRVELVLMSFATLCVVISILWPTPISFLAGVSVGALALRRIVLWQHPSPRQITAKISSAPRNGGSKSHARHLSDPEAARPAPPPLERAPGDDGLRAFGHRVLFDAIGELFLLLAPHWRGQAASGIRGCRATGGIW